MSDAKDLTLSISLVVYDLNESELKKCLDSLAKALRQVENSFAQFNWHITLVDNNPSDQRLNQFTGTHIETIENSENKGFGRAHNQVIERAKSTWHLVLNPDVIMNEDCMAKLLQLGQSREDIVMVGPRGESRSGTNAFLVKKFPSLWVLMLRGFMPELIQQLFEEQLADYECRNLPDDNSTVGVEIISGCCMLANTKALQKLGGFDPRYFLYFEDFDLCVRIAKIGKIAYEPRARIVHTGGHAAKKGWRHIAYFSRSAVRFFRSHSRSVAR